MNAELETRTVFCPGCNHKVRLTFTPEHGHAQANLPDGAQVVCLDFGEGCSEGVCPLTGRPGLVMGVRLARSHLPHEWTTLHGRCDACGAFTELEVVDATHAVCPVCDATNRYLVLPTGEGDALAITGL